MSQDDPSTSTYNNTHRAFLQALLSTQTITYTTAKPLLAAILTAQTSDRPTLPEDISQEDFETYIDALITQISPFDLEIRSTLHQTTKERIYALVNTTSDALTQMSTTHSADELAFVKRVLDAMFESYNTPRAEIMAIKSLQALKLARPSGEDRRRESQAANTQGKDAGLTQAQAEKVMETLKDEGWFELSAKGYYSLSPRALMELRGWLVEMYNDQEEGDDQDEDEEAEHVKIKFCAACKEIVTQGREQCPACKVAWTEPGAVGEKAARGEVRQSNGGSGGRQSNGGARREEMVDEESDSE
ncbi:hypothetical protein LTR86_002410 [Recurvomyces mirabilis]|nr:hypothetical protein LTR86_002410 [Recurvomyces mirabilis]